MVSDVRVYPVKSLGGQAVDQARVELAGLRHDRRWMVVSPDGEVVTARERHVLLSVTAGPRPTTGSLDGPGRAPILVRPPQGPPDVEVRLSRLDRATVRRPGRRRLAQRPVG